MLTHSALSPGSSGGSTRRLVVVVFFVLALFHLISHVQLQLARTSQSKWLTFEMVHKTSARLKSAIGEFDDSEKKWKQAFNDNIRFLVEFCSFSSWNILTKEPTRYGVHSIKPKRFNRLYYSAQTGQIQLADRSLSLQAKINDGSLTQEIQSI